VVSIRPAISTGRRTRGEHKVTKTRESGFADRVATAVLAMALLAGLAMAAETGVEPAAAPTRFEDAPVYVIPDARTAPFIDMLFFD